MTPTSGHAPAGYTLLATLGEGGMGAVHRARREATGELVALKLLHGADPGSVAAIRREIDALARLDHPGIVRIVEHGLGEDGLPWYAMELIEARPLDEPDALATSHDATAGHDTTAAHAVAAGLLTHVAPLASTTHTALPVDPATGIAPVVPEPRGQRHFDPERCQLELYAQLCLVLAWLHGEGVVHRDIKPGNVLVRHDGRVVVVDFGIAVESGAGIGREALVSSVQAAGTLHWMAPEQLAAEPVDARADLYAVGVMLYRAIAGRFPYAGHGGAAALIFAQLQGPPPPLAELVPDVPRALSRLVERLLAPKPRDRPGYAEEVAAVLAQHLRLPTDLAALRARWGLPAARPMLHRPDLVGRQHVLEALLEGTHQPGIAVLEAASGLGKTRLVNELHRALTDGRRRLRLLVATCARARRAALLAPLLDALEPVADHCRFHGAQETLAVLGAEGRVLAALRASWMALPGMATLPAPGPMTGAAARTRALVALEALVRRLAAELPLVIVLDDVQWADPWTRDWLGLLSVRLASEPTRVHVVLARRPPDPADASDTPLALDARLALAQHRLEPLGRDALAALVASMLALPGAPPAELLEALELTTGGSPLAVTESLRLAVDEGWLARDAEAGQWQVVAPAAALATSRSDLATTLHHVVERRLAALSPEERAHAELLAVFGRATAETVYTLAAEALEPAGLERLLARDVATRDPERGRLALAHDVLREVLLAGLAPEHRRRLHATVAAALSLVDLEDERVIERAWHHARAGQRAEARRCYHLGARAALERSAFSIARHAAEAWLALVEPADPAVPLADQLAMRRDLASALYYSGRSPEAVALAETVLAEAEAAALRDETLRCRLFLAGCNIGLGRFDDAHAHLACAEPLLELPRLRRERAELLDHRVNVLRARGELDAALAAGHEAVAELRALHRVDRVGAVLNNLAVVHWVRRDLDQARATFEAALVAHREAGHLANVAITLGNIALSHMEQGRHEAALPLYQEALALQRDLGDRRAEGMLLNNLGAWYERSGDLAEAHAILLEALAAHRQVGNRTGEGLALAELGQLEAAEGELERAHAHLRASREALVGGGQHALAASTVLTLATLVLDHGDPEAVPGHLEDARDLAGRARDEIGAALADLVAGQLALQRGELDAARALIEPAAATVEARGHGADKVRALLVRAELASEEEDAARLVEEARAQRAAIGRAEGSLLGRAIEEAAARVLSRTARDAPP